MGSASPLSGGGSAAAGQLYAALLAAHGPQRWWPAESPFEVAVGAILVQRTAWHHAAAAVRKLQAGGLLDPAAVLDAPEKSLEAFVRPAGFYRQKSRTLRGFCAWLLAAGDFDSLTTRATTELRADLLRLRGIGPETADCILLYALHRPVFVVDAYTRRILVRTGLYPGAERAGYDRVAAWFEQRLAPEPSLFNEFHALLVAHGKSRCGTRPDCPRCELAGACAYAAEA